MRYKLNVNITGIWHRLRQLKIFQKYLRAGALSCAGCDSIVDIVVNLFAIQLREQKSILQVTTVSSAKNNAGENYLASILAKNCVMSAKMEINLVVPKLK